MNKGNVYRLTPKRLDIDAPEESTIYELASKKKIWAKFGYAGNEPQTLVFIELNGYLHMYQKGSGLSDHVLFWVTCCDIGGSDESLISAMFGDDWSSEQ